jgi:ribosomal protein L24E
VLLSRSRRSVATVAMLLSAGVVLPLAPTTMTPAGAATTQVSISDARGDVKNNSGGAVSQPEGDIVSTSVDYRSDGIAFSMLVDKPTDPATDPHWAGGTTGAGWALDTNGDSKADYIVALGQDDTGHYAAQVGRPSDDNPSCTGTAGRGPHQEFTATIPASCVGTPASFRFLAVMTWDTDPNDDNAPVVADTAPDGGLSGVVEAPPGAPTGNTGTDQPDPNLTRESGGYWLTADDGGVFAFNTDFYGSTGAIKLNQPIVGMSATPTGHGYWFVASDGGIFSFGDAKFFGSTGSLRLNQPIVGMARTPSGNGYWLVARDGGIFAFGDAAFFGSTGNIKLNQPIVGMFPTPTGRGYDMVASDGGIFAFGDAAFYGSVGGVKLSQPIVAGVATPTGKGYWFVGRDGAVFAFGDAVFYGSATGSAAPVVGIAPAHDGAGYSIARADGSVAHLGSAPKAGSAAGRPLNRPVVGIAATP